MLALLFSSCSNSGNTTENPGEATEVEESQDPEVVVDWTKPIYSLGETEKDTLSKWEYNDKGLEIKEIFFDNGKVGETTISEYDANGNCIKNVQTGSCHGETAYTYDAQNRLVYSNGDLFSGNTHWFSSEFTYEGQKSFEMSRQSTEGQPGAYESKTVTYYMDPECRYDTLSQSYEKEVSYDADGNEVANAFSDTCVTYTTKKYQVVNGKTLLAESATYRLYEKVYELSVKYTYQYDEEGNVSKEITETSYDTTEANYTYDGNCQMKTEVRTSKDGRVDKSTSKTYYKVDEISE